MIIMYHEGMRSLVAVQFGKGEGLNVTYQAVFDLRFLVVVQFGKGEGKNATYQAVFDTLQDSLAQNRSFKGALFWRWDKDGDTDLNTVRSSDPTFQCAPACSCLLTLKLCTSSFSTGNDRVGLHKAKDQRAHMQGVCSHICGACTTAVRSASACLDLEGSERRHLCCLPLCCAWVVSPKLAYSWGIVLCCRFILDTVAKVKPYFGRIVPGCTPKSVVAFG